MAGASDSDDASELFWPGYVDAVTNLAINLLFVIAIMAIVVMTANLQISQMQPKQGGALDDANTPHACCHVPAAYPGVVCAIADVDVPPWQIA